MNILYFMVPIYKDVHQFLCGSILDILNKNDYLFNNLKMFKQILKVIHKRSNVSCIIFIFVKVL